MSLELAKGALHEFAIPYGFQKGTPEGKCCVKWLRFCLFMLVIYVFSPSRGNLKNLLMEGFVWLKSIGFRVSQGRRDPVSCDFPNSQVPGKYVNPKVNPKNLTPPGWRASWDFFHLEKMLKRMKSYLSFMVFFSKLNKKLAWMIRSQIILIVFMLDKHADTFSLPKVVVYSCSKIVKKIHSCL